MKDMDVRIVNLPPMRVACINGFGEGPEGVAFEKMKAWAQAHNLLEEPHTGIEVGDGICALTLRPFEIATVRLTRR